MSPRTILIVGPTAVGKSELAMALADHFPIEIVNGDALQVYRGLDIGTAKPTPEDRERVRHHLIDVLEPSQPFSAGEFRKRALPILAEIRSRGHWPVVVGGSGFYLRTLVSGISPIPEVASAVRREVREEHAREGLPAVRRRLEALDPETASRIDPGDTQRTLRALEVILATGRGLSDWWRASSPEPSARVVASLGLTLPRRLLYDRISLRVAAMFEAGWVDEVRGLLAEGCLPTFPAFQAIGYRQVVRHLRGEWTREQALEDVSRETRRFAKRQLTWLRQESDVDWFEADGQSSALPRVIATLGRRLGE